MVEITLIWYFFALGMLAIGTGMIPIILDRDEHRTVTILAFCSTILGTMLIALSVARDAVFVLAFGVAFGVIMAATNVFALRSANKGRARQEPR